MYLDPVVEFEDVHTQPMSFNVEEDDMDVSSFPAMALKDANQLISMMTTGSSNDFSMEVDEDKSEMASSENFNLNDVQGTSDNADSDAILDNFLEQCHPSKRVAPSCPKSKQPAYQEIATVSDSFDDNDGK